MISIEMRFVSRFVACLLVLACAYIPQSAMAQRFTSAGPSQSVGKPDTADTNAELSYEALKAGHIEHARDYLDDANPASPYAMFVQAALTQDAITAADIYKEIVAANEGKPIAREALLQLYRYHYAAGQYAAAHRDYVELQKFSIPPPVPDPQGLQDSLQAIPAFQTPQTSPRPAPEEKASTPAPTYLVQVGVFTTANNARRFIRQLKVYGVNGKLFRKDIGGKDLYGVSAGAFSSKDAADEMAKNLRGRSVDCVVVQK